MQANDEIHQDDLQNILKLVKQSSAALEKLTEQVNVQKTKLVNEQATLDTFI